MRRKLLVLCCLVGIIRVGNSQEIRDDGGVMDSYFAHRSQIFKNLNLSGTGSERFLELSNTCMDLRPYSDGSLGVWDDSLDLDKAYELWKLYEYGRTGTKMNEGAWDSFQVWTNDYLRKGIVPLLVVDFTYSRLSDSFWLGGNYRINEDSTGLAKLGEWRENDTELGYAFGIFPMVSVMRPEYSQLIIDPRFVLTDAVFPKPKGYGVEIDGMEQELPVGIPSRFHWKRGWNHLTFFMEGIDDSLRLALFKNPQFFSHGSKFARQLRFWWNAAWEEQIQRVFRGLPLEFVEYGADIQDLKSGETIVSGANVVIHYGKDTAGGKTRTCMRRPLVFVEGIDFGYSDLPRGCRDGKCGNIGYLDLLKGKEWNSQTGNWDEWLAIEHAPKVIGAYLDSGYDIVYVDFWYGSDWVEHNAQVLEVVLKGLSQRLCGDRMHVIGASMGGVVSRYTLNKMEEAGELGCIRSYSTFDSPLQGANIPLGMQQITNYLKGLHRYSRDAVNRKLNARASKQLLLYHFGSENDCDASRKEFVSSRYATEMPKQPWKMAIANGSGLGADGMQRLLDGSEMVSGSKLATVGITEFTRTVLDSLIAGCDDAAVRLLLLGSKKLLESTQIQWFSYAYGTKIGKNESHLTAMAVYGGGLHRKLFEVDVKRSGMDHQPGGKHDGILAFKFNALVLGGTVFADRTCFIPTWSALNLSDIGQGWVKPLGMRFGNTWGRVNETGFDDFYVPEENQEHVYFDSSLTGNVFWLLNRLLWLDKSKIQSASKTTDWFGSASDRFLQLSAVAEGKILSINHPQELVKLPKDRLSLVGNLKERIFYISPCFNQTFRVENGSTLRLGSGIKGNQRTVLEVGSGLTLEVESGGVLLLEGGQSCIRVNRGAKLEFKDKSVLEVWNGSSVVIEEGAEVIFGDGVDFRLIGTGSIFHVKGKLKMLDGARWVVEPFQGNEVGMVKFSGVGPGYGTFSFQGKDNTINLVGNGKYHGVTLQMEGKIDLRNGLDTFNLFDVEGLLGKSTSVLLDGEILMEYCLLGSRNWSYRSSNRWILDSGNLHFRGNTVEGLSGGLVLGRRLNLKVMDDNRFMDNDTALVLNAEAFELTKNRFDDNEIGLVVVGNGSGKKVIREGYWLNNGGGLIFNQSDRMDISPLFMRENYFVSNGFGIKNTDTKMGLRCCNFVFNDTGVVQRGGVLSMGAGSGLKYGLDTVLLGDNTFDKNNAMHIVSEEAALYFNGTNNFQMDRSYSGLRPVIQGTVLPFCTVDSMGQYLSMGKTFFWPKSSNGFQDVFKKHVQLSSSGKKLWGNGKLLDSLNKTCYVPMMVWNGDKNLNLEEGAGIDSVFGLEKSAPMLVKVYDIQGRLLDRDINFVELRKRISPGIYLVEWEYGHGKEIKKVLIDK